MRTFPIAKLLISFNLGLMVVCTTVASRIDDSAPIPSSGTSSKSQAEKMAPRSERFANLWDIIAKIMSTHTNYRVTWNQICRARAETESATKIGGESHAY